MLSRNRLKDAVEACEKMFWIQCKKGENGDTLETSNIYRVKTIHLE